MKIQIISNNSEAKSLFTDDLFFVTSFNAPFSMEAFDLTIIDFQNPNTWMSHGNSIFPLDIENDLLSIKEIVNNTNKSLILIALPQNYVYQFHNVNGKFYGKGNLKDSIETTYKTINPIIQHYGNYSWYYETNITSLRDYTYISEFSFDKMYSFCSITKADFSHSLTTLFVDKKLYLTTLYIMRSQDELVNFLKAISVLPEESDYPTWLNSYSFYNDTILKEQLEKNSDRITQLEAKNEAIQKELSDNLRYKSILTSSGAPLMDVVFDILGKLLDCDLSSFEDKKNEDFVIEKDEIVFVGEIKGVSSNVKRTNLSQIELHCQKYFDDNDVSKPIKGLLIINHQRQKNIDDREPIHEDHIKLADSYGVLIVETESLLKLYDRYLNGLVSTEEIIQLFKDNIGLLSV